MCPFLMQKNKGELRMNIKINKKTVFILVLLIAAMIFSVFAITNTILTNKAVTDMNISPYAYRMVVAYFAYWKSGDSYYADINGVRTNIGQVPYQKFVPSYEFPVALIPGNYAIDDIMNYKDYIGSVGTWEDLNYSGLRQNQVEDHYMNTAVIENKEAIVGEKNTTVTFRASFKPLNPPDTGLSPDPYDRYAENREGVYYSYIAIVIKYKNLDYVEPPVDPDPGSGDITLEIEYRENTTTGRKLIDSKTINIKDGEIVNLNSYKVDDYICKGHFIMGQTTEYFYSTNVNFTTSKENYSKPVDGKLKTIFIYEKVPYVSIPKCSPTVYGDTDIINITMKKKDFENASEINISNAILKIGDFKAGKDSKGNSVTGSHDFNYFDVYIGDSGKYYFTSYDNSSKEIRATFKVPKEVFSQSSVYLYTTSLDVTYAGYCKCYDGKPDADGDNGWSIDNGNLGIYVNLIANKPPVADFTYFTRKKINGEFRGIINEKAYVGQETVIKNKAYDPNGKEDIKKLIYNLTDSSGKQYTVNLSMKGDMYFLDSENVRNNITFVGFTNEGDIILTFETEDTWIVKQYVEDTEGLNDIYERNITTEILNLKPTAVIEDNVQYRYPVTKSFNGKQNRVMQFNSSYSYLSGYYEGVTEVTVDNKKDNWEIVPMNNQDINSIKFSSSINTIIDDNILRIKYQNLNNVKMMFKETGQYKLRLQVTDTQGNISDWTEKVITVNVDAVPAVTAVLSEKEYRDSTGIAEIKLNNISPYSSDEDNAFVENIKYRYDSNNNGRFDDEIWFVLEGNKLRTSDLGNYQFMITVKENFGQETLPEYINDLDYKRWSKILNTEIDNIAPNISTFKIMTTEN